MWLCVCVAPDLHSVKKQKKPSNSGEINAFIFFVKKDMYESTEKMI